MPQDGTYPLEQVQTLLHSWSPAPPLSACIFCGPITVSPGQFAVARTRDVERLRVVAGPQPRGRLGLPPRDDLVAAEAEVVRVPCGPAPDAQLGAPAARAVLRLARLPCARPCDRLAPSSGHPRRHCQVVLRGMQHSREAQAPSVEAVYSGRPLAQCVQACLANAGVYSTGVAGALMLLYVRTLRWP